MRSQTATSATRAKPRRRRRTSAAPTPAPVTAPTSLDAARQRLRDFSEFIAGQQPEQLAAAVVAVDDTLRHCRVIRRFFVRYVLALEHRAADAKVATFSTREAR